MKECCVNIHILEWSKWPESRGNLLARAHLYSRAWAAADAGVGRASCRLPCTKPAEQQALMDIPASQGYKCQTACLVSRPLPVKTWCNSRRIKQQWC